MAICVKYLGTFFEDGILSNVIFLDQLFYIPYMEKASAADVIGSEERKTYIINIERLGQPRKYFFSLYNIFKCFCYCCFLIFLILFARINNFPLSGKSLRNRGCLLETLFFPIPKQMHFVTEIVLLELLYFVIRLTAVLITTCYKRHQ